MKLSTNAVIRLDRIIRNTRSEIERTAKRLATEAGKSEVDQQDLEDAAVVVFESSHEPLMNPRKA